MCSDPLREWKTQSNDPMVYLKASRKVTKMFRNAHGKDPDTDTEEFAPQLEKPHAVTDRYLFHPVYNHRKVTTQGGVTNRKKYTGQLWRVCSRSPRK